MSIFSPKKPKAAEPTEEIKQVEGRRSTSDEDKRRQRALMAQRAPSQNPGTGTTSILGGSVG